MNHLKLEQIRYECETWKRAVSFMMEESVSMKTRLAEILKHQLDGDLLEGLERLQNLLVSNDELIGVFRDDLSFIDRFIYNEPGATALSDKQFEKKIDRLQHNLLYLEKHFSKLKLEFNDYLWGNMGLVMK